MKTEELDKYHVLIIDDDKVDRRALRSVLLKTSVEVETSECNTADDALAMVAEKSFDCIFLDYLLPGTDGLELLKKFRHQGNTTPIVIVTSQGNEEIAVEMMKAGASDYVVKNQIEVSTLEKLINSILRINAIEREKEAALNELKISRARLTEAQKIAKIGSWEYDFRNRAVFWSREMFNIFEKDREFFHPTLEDFLDFIHPADRHVLAGATKVKHDQYVGGDARVISKEMPQKYVNLQAYVIHDDQGNRKKLVGTAQDITERKLTEQELIKARKIAEESVNIKEQFLANMSHEIRTPMNAIIGFTNMILMHAENLDDEQKKQLNSIYHAGENLLVIINDILDFSKLRSGKLKLEKIDFDLHELVQTVLHMFQNKVREKKIDLIVDIDKNVPDNLIGDPVRLNQILVNLISNAVKFTDKGFIRLQIKVLSIRGQRTRIQFEVEDSGIGIESSKLEGIFESFTQATNETTRLYGGTGLGLSIVKNIVDLKGGEINVKSSPGKGTLFTLEIPFKIGADAPTSQKPGSQSKKFAIQEAQEIRAIMAEDNEMNQELGLLIFKEIGWHLDIASNGKEALNMLRTASYDIVLMDIQMPILDGFETTKAIRNEFAPPINKIPILALSAHAMPSEIEKCLRVGMNDYISKPFRINELLSKISTLANGPEIRTQAEENRNKLYAQKYYDLNYLYSLTRENKEEAAKLIDLFVEQIPERIDHLKQSLDKEDWQDLKAQCHKTKSSFFIIGAEEIRQDLQTIENDCSNHKINKKKFSKIIDHCSTVTEMIVSDLKESSAPFDEQYT